MENVSNDFGDTGSLINFINLLTLGKKIIVGQLAIKIF